MPAEPLAGIVFPSPKPLAAQEGAGGSRVYSKVSLRFRVAGMDFLANPPENWGFDKVGLVSRKIPWPKSGAGHPPKQCTEGMLIGTHSCWASGDTTNVLELLLGWAIGRHSSNPR